MIRARSLLRSVNSVRSFSAKPTFDWDTGTSTVALKVRDIVS